MLKRINYFFKGVLDAIFWYAETHKLPFVVFGSLFAIVFAVFGGWAIMSEESLVKHAYDREVMHSGWGALLYMLFSRLLLMLERLRNWELGWKLWYFIPLSCVLALALNQEFGFPGDFRTFYGTPTMWKSFPDIACWMIGAIATAWYTYFMAVRLHTARIDYLQR